MAATRTGMVYFSVACTSGQEEECTIIWQQPGQVWFISAWPALQDRNRSAWYGSDQDRYCLSQRGLHFRSGTGVHGMVATRTNRIDGGLEYKNRLLTAVVSSGH